jgi:hypothetical protein
LSAARASTPASGAGDASLPVFSRRSSTRRSIVEGDAAVKRNSGSSGDTTAVGKRNSGNSTDTMTAPDTLKKARDKQTLTTVEELWDLLKNTDGHLHNRIELDTFVDFFDAARVLDVSRTLAKVVPCHKGARGCAVDMTKARMRHLCGLLMQNGDLSLPEARMVLECVDESSLEEDTEDGLPANRVQQRMSYKTFRKLFEILPELMYLQQEVIIAQLAWERSSRLELPEPIIVQIMMTFCGKGEQTKEDIENQWLILSDDIEKQCPILRNDTKEDIEKQWPTLSDDSDAEQTQKQQELNRQLVYRVLTLNDFLIFCRCGQIVDPTSKTCAKSQELENVYVRVHRKITELLEAHAKKRNRPAPKAPARHDQGLVGRNEVEVLLSEVWALKPLASTYTGPFDLIAQMLQRALTEPFLDRAKKWAAERSGSTSTVIALACVDA